MKYYLRGGTEETGYYWATGHEKDDAEYPGPSSAYHIEVDHRFKYALSFSSIVEAMEFIEMSSGANDVWDIIEEDSV